jgi:polysaccharide biosynthesis protein PslA
MRAERLAWAETPKPAEPSLAADGELVAAPITRRRRLFHRSLVRTLARSVDAAAILLVTLGLCRAGGIDVWTTPLAAALPFVLMPLAGVAGVSLAGGYRFRYADSFAGHLCRVGFGASAIMGSVVLLAWLAGSSNVTLFARLAAANALAVFALHANYLAAVRAATRKGFLADNVVIVGATQTAARIASRNARERDLNILGYFDERAERASMTLMGDTPYLGVIDDLLSWERLPEVDRIIVTVTSTAQERVRSLIDRMRNLPHEIILVLDLDGFNPEQTSLARVVDAPAAYVSGAPRDIRRAAVKRVFDVMVAMLAGVLLAPLMALIALAVRLDTRGPAFVQRKRYGFNNEIIHVWNFRAHALDRADGATMDESLTRVGRLVHAANLKELPHLLNVLKGEMSIVGPKPHAAGASADDVAAHRTVSEYAHRHRMKPGMTGWAQINGYAGPARTGEEARRRIALDLDYVSRASVWFDAWIVLLTVPRLFGGRPTRR